MGTSVIRRRAVDTISSRHCWAAKSRRVLRGCLVAQAVVLAVMTASCCKSAGFPLIIRGAEPMRRDALVETFRTVQPALKFRGPLSTALDRSDVRARLQDANLLRLAVKAAPTLEVDVIAWESDCLFRRTDFVLGVFGPTGEALVVDGEELFYSLATIAH